MNTRFSQVRMTAVVALAMAGFSVYAADVSTGTPDVNQVQGRASVIAKAAKPAKVGGFTTDVLGRASNIPGSASQDNIASRAPDGLLAQYGRAAPTYAITYKGASTETMAAKGW
jgi:hypothetical protein